MPTKTESEPLRIIQLDIKNVQRVRALSITPTGDLVKVEGKNRAGKTSVLRSIAMALGGKAQFSDKPLRDGEREGEIVAKLGDAEGNLAYTVRRTWTDEGKEALTFTDAEGVPVKGPETMLKALVGNGIAFDPLAFINADAKSQGETLRKLTGLDTSDLDREREEVYAQRKLVNRDLSTAQAALRGMTPPRAGLPETAPVLADLIAERDQKQAIIRANAERRRDVDGVRIAVGTAERDVERLQKDLNDAKVRLKKHEDALAAAETGVALLADPDLSTIDQQLKDAQAIGDAVRARDGYQNADKHVKGYQVAADALTKRIEELDREKAERIGKSTMPVEGLGFDADGQATFNGLPIKQASDAEQFQIGTSIALSGNARAKIALINHGNELDSDGLKLLSEIVAKAGATCWIARVTDGDGDGFVIEDGMLKSEPVPQEAAAGA